MCAEMGNYQAMKRLHHESTKVPVDEAYSDPAWWYNVRGFGILTFAYRDTLWRQVGFFEQYMSEEHHLEAAVGTGTLLGFVLRYRSMLGKRVLPRNISAIDYAPRMVEGARKALRYKSVAIDIAVGDVVRLPYENDMFQSVAIANSIHCVDDPDAAIQELYRVAAPGGVVTASILLHPRGSGFQKKVAQGIIDWGARKGLVVSSFDRGDVVKKFLTVGFSIEEEDVKGNALNIALRK